MKRKELITLLLFTAGTLTILFLIDYWQAEIHRKAFIERRAKDTTARGWDAFEIEDGGTQLKIAVYDSFYAKPGKWVKISGKDTMNYNTLNKRWSYRSKEQLEKYYKFMRDYNKYLEDNGVKSPEELNRKMRKRLESIESVESIRERYRADTLKFRDDSLKAGKPYYRTFVINGDVTHDTIYPVDTSDITRLIALPIASTIDSTTPDTFYLERKKRISPLWYIIKTDTLIVNLDAEGNIILPAKIKKAE